jgi:hypothetical protein
MIALLSELLRAQRVMNAVAAGTSDQNSLGVDLSADGLYDSVLFVVSFGTLTAGQVTKLKAQVSSDDGSSDPYSDVANSLSASLADGDSNKVALLDVHHAPEKWVRLVVDRGTQNVVIDGVVALPYNNKKPAISAHSTLALTKTVIQQRVGAA